MAIFPLIFFFAAGLLFLVLLIAVNSKAGKSRNAGQE